MKFALTFVLTLAFALPAHAVVACNPDGSLLESNEFVLKLFALHYANRDTQIPDLKRQAANYNVTYKKPACDENGHELLYKDLDVVLTPK